MKVAEAIDCRAGARESARRNALVKARLASIEQGEGIIIGADTLVTYGRRIFGKPDTRKEARKILSRLSGTTHKVVTAVALVDAYSGKEEVQEEVTAVTMRHLSRKELDSYVKSGEGLGKAGAFAVQETASDFIVKIEGDFSNVVGFPVALFKRMLETMK